MAIKVAKQYAFYFDQTRCTGCQTCSIACKDWNGVNPGTANYRTYTDIEAGEFPNISVKNIIYSCNHCESPACIDACSAGAIYKRQSDGIVIINRDLCQGLNQCKNACPYAAPQFADDGQEPPTLAVGGPTKGHTAQKCTMCWDRVSPANSTNNPSGEYNTMKPACVNSCLARALDFGTIEELMIRYPHAQTVKTGALEGFPDDAFGSDGRRLATRTNPSFLFKARS